MTDEAGFLSEVRSKLGMTMMSDRQKQLCAGAFDLKPSAVLVMLERAESANNPAAYFFGGCAKMVDETPAPAKQVDHRHDLAEVACLDCGDTGFVILTRDVGPDALAGDAAACHCATGQHKLHKQDPKKGSTGTRVNLPNLPMINYSSDDFEPLVPDPSTRLVTIGEYARSEAGRNDPHLRKFLILSGTAGRSLADEIDWTDDRAG